MGDLLEKHYKILYITEVSTLELLNLQISTQLIYGQAQMPSGDLELLPVKNIAVVGLERLFAFLSFVLLCKVFKQSKK